MKKYEYVSVVYEGVYASQVNEHRQIIDKRAAEGWRYVGYIPTREAYHGQTCSIDLIFEKDADEAE